MLGMTLKSIKKHYSLIPLYVVVFMGVGGATFYTIRLATRNPDVRWNKSNTEPWQEFADKQYKFYSPTIDYSKLKSDAPKF